MELTTFGVEIIQEYGINVFIILWFMLRNEKVINRNTEALTKIAKRIR